MTRRRRVSAEGAIRQGEGPTVAHAAALVHRAADGVTTDCAVTYRHRSRASDAATARGNPGTARGNPATGRGNRTTQNGVTDDGAVHHCQGSTYIIKGDAAASAKTFIIVNRAVAYVHCPASTDAATGAILALVAADYAIRHSERSASADADATAAGVGRKKAPGIVAEDAGAAECEPSVVKDAAPSVVVASGGKTIRDGEAGDGDVGPEIFKHAGSGVAVDRQISRTGAVDGHAVINLKFAAGQQDGAGDAGSVNRVALIRDGERVAQRAGAVVIGICDYDDGNWKRIAHFRQTFARAAELGHP